jgi:hypothetical protein
MVWGDTKPFLDHLPIPFPSPLVGECVMVGDRAGDEPNDLGDRRDAAAVSRSVRGMRLSVSCLALREARYWDMLLRAGLDVDWVGEGSLDRSSWRRDVNMVLNT